ncbi:hypothetical protein [Prosthecomicrobium sp. N25]|uniref:hypothetical protein n=1 Tax=Prosthecomicrobium sp. N25 TaxID=3129254 RepID=UPI003078441E
MRARAGLALLAVLAGPAAAASIEHDDPGLGALVATRERPLFSPSRRAPAAPPAPDVQPAAVPVPVAEPVQPPAAQLMGVVIGGDMRMAVFADNGRTLTVRQGEEIEGWTIADVQRRAIVLERDGETLELKLRDPAQP